MKPDATGQGASGKGLKTVSIQRSVQYICNYAAVLTEYILAADHTPTTDKCQRVDCGFFVDRIERCDMNPRRRGLTRSTGYEKAGEEWEMRRDERTVHTFSGVQDVSVLGLPGVQRSKSKGSTSPRVQSRRGPIQGS